MTTDTNLILGDCRNLTQHIAPATVQCVVTSPPFYGLRDYKTGGSVWGGNPDCEHEFEKQGHFKTFCQCGAWFGNLGLEPTPDMFTEHLVEIFRVVKKALKDDGTVFLNLGDCYFNGKVAGSCVAADKLKRDEEDWKELKHADPKNRARRFGRRPIDCPIPGFKPKDLMGIPWRVALALQADGWYLRDAIIWAKAVVDEDGVLTGGAMPGPQKDRCTPSYEFVFQLSKSKKYFFNIENAKSTTGSTFRNVWKITKEYRGYKHFASFPLKLVERCVLIGSREGDVVLDPFMGSGTTAVVCRDLARQCIGIEISEDYHQLSLDRLHECE